MKRPEDDETSVGRVLIAMGVCTPGQVARAAELQRKMAEDERIGVYLVAHGHASLEQLRMAINAQEGLRSKAKHKRALAQATIAQQSGASVVSLADRVMGRAAEVRKKTGQGYPAVQVAKAED